MASHKMGVKYKVVIERTGNFFLRWSIEMYEIDQRGNAKHVSFGEYFIDESPVWALYSFTKRGAASRAERVLKLRQAAPKPPPDPERYVFYADA